MLRCDLGFREFIPEKVNNKLVLNVYDLISQFGKLFIDLKEAHARMEANSKAERNHLSSKRPSYIEDQRNYSDMHYGMVSMQYAGCEIFSVYNAFLYVFGKEIIPLSEMIYEFEQDGITLNGRWGSSPKAIGRYLKRKGLKTKRYHKYDMLEACEGENCIIITFYNNSRDIMDQVHTVCVTKELDGYYVHNLHCNGENTGPFNSFEQLVKSINKGRAKLINAIVIK